jgi:predicted nucleotidyltransferase
MSELVQRIGLTKDEILSRLLAHEAEIRTRFGVSKLSLFGSVASDTASPTSDVDMLVDFDRAVGLFHLFALQDYLETLLDGCQVDLVVRDSIFPRLRDRILAEAIDVVG